MKLTSLNLTSLRSRSVKTEIFVLSLSWSETGEFETVLFLYVRLLFNAEQCGRLCMMWMLEVRDE